MKPRDKKLKTSLILALVVVAMVTLLYIANNGVTKQPQAKNKATERSHGHQISADSVNKRLTHKKGESSGIVPENKKVSFSASPKSTIPRNRNNLVLFPDVIITDRDFKKGSVFDGAIIQVLPTKPKGSLTFNEATISAVEAQLDLSEVERFLASDAEYLPVPISRNEQALLSVQKVYDRGEHTVTLSGTVKGQSVSTAMFVFHDGAMSGTVELFDDERYFDYGLSGDGSIAVREVDRTKVDEGKCTTCDNPDHMENPLAKMLSDEVVSDERYFTPIDTVSAAASYPEGSSVADMFVGYEPVLTEKYGGAAANEARIVQAVDNIHAAFDRSGITNIYVALLGTEESSALPAFSWDTLGADIACQLRDGGSSFAAYIAGLGEIPGYEEESDQNAYMYVEEASITNSNSSFVHEYGHLAGCFHAWGDTADFSTHRRGWRFITTDTQTRYRTLMSYNSSVTAGSARVGYFSNPEILVGGARTGVENGYDATGDVTVDQSLVSGGGDGIYGPGYDGSNPDLGANNALAILTYKDWLPAKNVRSSAAIVYPRETFTYYINDTMNISWIGQAHTTPVSIDLYKGDQFIKNVHTTSEGVNADEISYFYNTYDFLITSDIVPGNDYQISITIDDLVLRTGDLSIQKVTPVAYWPMDDLSGSTVVDASGNGHDGSGIPEERVEGVLGGAFQFNATSEGIDLPEDTLSSFFYSNITVSVWIYGDDVQAQNQNILNAVANGGDEHLDITLPNNNSEIEWMAENEIISKEATTTDFKEQWNHWVFTKSENADVNIYLNGELWHSAESSWNGFLDDRLASFVVGAGYQGKIDELIIYNDVLNATQAKALFYDISGNHYPRASDIEILPNIDIPFNATDLDSDSLTYEVRTQPLHGTLTGVMPDITYTPGPTFTSSSGDSFTYTASDGSAKSSVATVTVLNAPMRMTSVSNDSGYHISPSEAAAFRSTGVTKTYDLDGDNAYGTSGHFIFGTGSGNGNNKPYSDNSQSLSNWIDNVEQGADFSAVSQYDAYSDFDNPTLPISTDVADWIRNGAGDTTVGSTNTWAELLKFTVNTDHPGIFRVGVMAGNHNNNDPVGLRLSYDNTITVEATGLDDSLGMVFFDIEISSNDAPFTFSVQALRDGEATSIAGLTFDEATASTGFAQWVTNYPAIGTGSPTEDGDSDSIPLLIEYILGANPQERDESMLPSMTTGGSNTQVNFERSMASTQDTIQMLQYSTSLLADEWQDIHLDDPEEANVTLGSDINGMQSVTVTLPSEDNLFYRLKVQLK